MADVSKEDITKLRQQLLRDYGPSSRAQSYQFVFWRQLGDQLGQPFDATKIPLSKLYQMRRDPMIAFALHFIKVPLIRAPWYIQCDDAQVAAFVDYALRRIYARLVLQYMQSLDFGYAAIVKRFEQQNPIGTYIDPSDPDKTEKPIWDEGNVDAIIWKSFVGLPPEQVEPLWTGSGEFNGIRFDVKKDVPLAFPTSAKEDFDDGRKVPLNLALWITNEKDTVFGSPWGYPRIGYAFRYWWSYWYRWALADRHFEKDADPPAIVRYPDDPNNEVLDANGNVVDYQSIALGIGEQARSGSTIAMPSTVVQSELDGRPSSIYEWDMKFLEGGSNFDAFDKTFDRLEVLKLRSIWVPEQAFLEGRGGTSSRNVAQTLTDSFQESQAVLMAEFDDHLNKYVIPQLVAVNFPEFNGEARKVTRGFGTEDIDFAKQIIQLVGTADPTKLEVDTRSILDQLGVPLKSPEVLEAERQKAIEDAQAMAPPDGIETIPGKQAGTTSTPDKSSDTGFSVKYVQPRERIYLSEPFASGLPETQPYQDEKIMDAARAHRADWQLTYADFYETFAQHMANEQFSESIEFADDPDGRAQEILRRFQHSMSDMRDSTKNFLRSVMERAGNRELRRAKFSTDVWNPDADSPAGWADRHAATLVKGVEDTTREELRRFLSEQIGEGKTNVEIADAIREHFVTFPDWKADRLARTEVAMAYNYATLFAGKAAGVSKVQAIDAQKGKTDEECERRNGKIFDIDDAFTETTKEHPNGTLSWRLLRQTSLSVEKLPADKADGKLAWYDPTTDTIYMAEDISPEEEERYLIMQGQILADA